MTLQTILQHAGGVKKLAEIAGVPEKTVYNWGRPRTSRGCGGIIPERYRAKILARLTGLTYADFRDLVAETEKQDAA